MDNVIENVSDTSQDQLNVNPQITEKMIPQSQVNEIVGSAKRDAAERAVEAYKRQQLQQSPVSDSQEMRTNRSVSEDDIKRLTGDVIKRHFGKIEQEAQERANMEAANRIVGMFKDKVIAGKDKFEDFESVTSNVAMQYYPNVVQLLAEHVDNTADVLYHLAKNRDKMYRLETLSGHNPSDAIYEIKRLSDSIKSNEESSQMKDARTPLSQHKPSNTGTGSVSALSLRDLKQKYKG